MHRSKFNDKEMSDNYMYTNTEWMNRVWMCLISLLQSKWLDGFCCNKRTKAYLGVIQLVKSKIVDTALVISKDKEAGYDVE